MAITNRPFGVTKAGEAVTCWTMDNGRGMAVEVLDWGCVIRSITVPDKAGVPTDVVLGYDDLAGYEAGNCFFGAFVGRYANRIKGASFSLGGKAFQLEKNDGDNHLHGAYCTAVFSGAEEDGSLVFRRRSPNGEEGYPGALELEVRYTLTERNELKLAYTAKTDADTVVNLTNHSYFNLAGRGDVLDHLLRLDCDRFTEADAETLPTGRILPVEGTALDFRSPKALGDVLQSGDPLLTPFLGCDHNLIFGASPTGSAFCPRSGIRLDMATTQPAVQLYTGNYVDADKAPHGKGGVRYPRYAGFCLETQHYPCSPNFPSFPSTVLKAGETYRQETAYAFSTTPL